MIVFDLICREQHRFEGWFASGEDFAAQQSSGLVNCPVCGGVHIEKLPTAKIKKHSADPAAAATGGAVQNGQGEQPTAARIIDYILEHSEDVGNGFAEEARKIYYQEAPQRNIRGVASRGEADDLREEGVPVFSLPIPPKDRWN